MLSGMLGRKVGMTQIFGANGAIIPVTIIEAGPCTVTQVKTEPKTAMRLSSWASTPSR